MNKILSTTIILIFNSMLLNSCRQSESGDYIFNTSSFWVYQSVHYPGQSINSINLCLDIGLKQDTCFRIQLH